MFLTIFTQTLHKPGFGFVIARVSELKKCRGYARSLSLDLYDQRNAMETGNGKWRYTLPTHVVRAFSQAMIEIFEGRGVNVRYEPYKKNQSMLVTGMKKLEFIPLLPEEFYSPIIISFCYPEGTNFTFKKFYLALKKNEHVIYPGKISKANTFRIGNIGDVYEADITGLLEEVHKCVKTRA